MDEFIKVHNSGGSYRELNLATPIRDSIILEDNRVNTDIVLSDFSFTPWSMPGGNGTASLSDSYMDRYAFHAVTNGASAALGYCLIRRAIEPTTFVSSDVIQFEIYCYNANNSRRVRFTFATDSAYVNKVMFDGFTGSMRPGHNLISFKLAAGTYSGTGASTDVWKYVEISFTGPDYQTELHFEGGPIYISRAIDIPSVIVTFDSAHKQLYTWAFETMKRLGIPGNVYVAGNLSTNVTANYCSVAELKQMRNAGWGMGIYGYVGSLSANGHSATTITTAQSIGAGANFTINGTFASGGVAYFDSPRPVVLTCNGNETANGITVEGLNENGVNIVRQISGNSPSSFRPYSADLFTTISRVTAIKATSGTLSIGTGRSKTELLSDSLRNQAFLKENSLDGDPLNYAFPLGEYNHLSEVWLREAGVIAARTTATGTNMFSNQFRRANRNNRYLLACAVTLGDTGGFAAFKAQVDYSINAGQDIYILSHLDAPSAPNRDDLDKGLAYLSTLYRQRLIRFDTFSSYEKLLNAY